MTEERELWGVVVLSEDCPHKGTTKKTEERYFPCSLEMMNPTGKCDFLACPIRPGTMLLDACKAAYRKHHLNDESIGWDELSDILYTALCNSMGDDRFVAWLEELNSRSSY